MHVQQGPTSSSVASRVASLARHQKLCLRPQVVDSYAATACYSCDECASVACVWYQSHHQRAYTPCTRNRLLQARNDYEIMNDYECVSARPQRGLLYSGRRRLTVIGACCSSPANTLPGFCSLPKHMAQNHGLVKWSVLSDEKWHV